LSLKIPCIFQYYLVYFTGKKEDTKVIFCYVKSNGYGGAWIFVLPDGVQVVAGSNPVAPTNLIRPSRKMREKGRRVRKTLLP